MLSPARTEERAGVSILVFGDAGSAGRAAAEKIQLTVHAAVADRGRAVLGLASGSTPRKVYSHLVALHREGALSFRDVVTYNVDEFYPIGPLDPKSYRSYMHQHLFSHVDLAPHHAHVFD
ncbi:MAG: 6-phosphogluconolactonase, partial [Isosphaeraceae bacterium]